MERSARRGLFVALLLGAAACDADAAPPSVTSSHATVAPQAPMKIGTNLWNLGWGIWDDIFNANVVFTPGTDPWRATFLQEVAPYAAIRFMDFAETNGSEERHWSDRTPPDAPAGAQTRLAYEWMIDLCNRLHRDMWVNVPHQADDAYAVNLATLIKTRLDPSLRVFVEWSNETWNGVFAQTQYAYDQGNALHLDPDPWTAAFKYHVYAAVRVFQNFGTVFGNDSPRVVKVLAGFSPNTWITQQHLAALADPVINPTHVTAHAYAIAPYFGRDVDGAAPDAPQQLRASMVQSLDDVRQQHEIVAAAGLTLVAYEGGQHVLNNAQMVNDRPEMYAIYKDYLDGLAPHLALFMHYVHNGNWSPGGAWGAERAIGAPLAQSPKLRAIFDWIRAH